MAELKKGVSRFQFVGKVKINDKTFALNQKGKNNPNFVFNQMNLGIDCGTQESNIVFAKMMAGYDTSKDGILYCHGVKQDGERIIDDYEHQIQVPFSKRFEERDDLGESCYTVIGIVKDVNDKVVPKKFLSQYDAIQYLNENLKDGMVVNVKGTLKYSSYNGKTQTERTITSIWLSNAETKDFRAGFEQTVWFTQDGFTGEPDDKGYLTLYGYVVDYYNKDIKNVCYPYSISIDTKAMPKYNIIIETYLRPKNPDGVNKVNIEGRFIKTDNTVDITYEELSDDLKKMVDVGLLTQEDALGRAIGSARGESKVVLKSICTKKDTDTGVVTLLIDSENSKVEDIIKVPEKTEAEEVLDSVGSESKPVAKTIEAVPVSDDLINDLFGTSI